MAISLDEFAARLEVVVKEQVEIVGRVRDEFQDRLNALLSEAKGDAEDLSEQQLTMFTQAMDRMNQMIEEV
jgi:hypothetical protein